MKKIQTIQKILKDNEMILIDSSFDVLGLIEMNMSFNANEYDMNLLIGSRSIYLICEALFVPMVSKKQMKIIKGESIHYLENSKSFIYDIKAILKKENIKRLGLVNRSLARHFNEVVTFGFISPLKTLGIVKTEKELRGFSSCARIIKRVKEKGIEALQSGMSDVQFRNELDMLIYEHGAQRRYVPTLVGFDSKTLYPTLTGRKLGKGDIVYFDIGAMKDGFGLNMSFTTMYGNGSKTKNRHIAVVRDGLEVMKAMVKEGVHICDIDAELRHFFANHRLSRYFTDYSVKLPGNSFFEYINSVNDKTKLYKNSLLKLTSSLFVPGKYGIKTDTLLIVTKRGYNEII